MTDRGSDPRRNLLRLGIELVLETGGWFVLVYVWIRWLPVHWVVAMLVGVAYVVVVEWSSHRLGGDRWPSYGRSYWSMPGWTLIPVAVSVLVVLLWWQLVLE
ncbi:MAG: hypothetical protein F4059_01365 [Gemmatimonadetes bacterium]|nr:hypothetical protein [Gemmatimonadota bacterium]